MMSVTLIYVVNQGSKVNRHICVYILKCGTDKKEYIKTQ
jgi:hypothetical protein